MVVEPQHTLGTPSTEPHPLPINTQLPFSAGDTPSSLLHRKKINIHPSPISTSLPSGSSSCFSRAVLIPHDFKAPCGVFLASPYPTPHSFQPVSIPQPCDHFQAILSPTEHHSKSITALCSHTECMAPSSLRAAPSPSYTYYFTSTGHSQAMWQLPSLCSPENVMRGGD